MAEQEPEYSPDRKEGTTWFIDNHEFSNMAAAKKYLIEELGFTDSEAIAYLKAVWGRP